MVWCWGAVSHPLYISNVYPENIPRWYVCHVLPCSAQVNRIWIFGAMLRATRLPGYAIQFFVFRTKVYMYQIIRRRVRCFGAVRWWL